jgi:hypothetical protein
MNKEPEKIPEYELLKKDEIAICVDGDTIFSLLPNCITKVFTNVGFKEPVVVNLSNPKRGLNEFTDVYFDNFGNSLLVSYRQSQIELEDLGLVLCGYAIDPFAELYIEQSGSFIRINVRDYIEMYDKNVFPSAISKIMQKIIKKEHELNRIFA